MFSKHHSDLDASVLNEQDLTSEICSAVPKLPLYVEHARAGHGVSLWAHKGVAAREART